MRLLFLALAMIAAQPTLAASDDAKGRKDEDAKARKELVGVWKGQVDEGATGHVLTFTTATITGTKDGRQSLGAGSFKLDLSADPPRMDATRTKGGKKGEKYLGIYSLDGDTLKWCVGLPGGKRPTELATKEGQFLLILKREPPPAER
jgi:uncharacterized protein (TIGR03067 family)